MKAIIIVNLVFFKKKKPSNRISFFLHHYKSTMYSFALNRYPIFINLTAFVHKWYEEPVQRSHCFLTSRFESCSGRCKYAVRMLVILFPECQISVGTLVSSTTLRLDDLDTSKTNLTGTYNTITPLFSFY